MDAYLQVLYAKEQIKNAEKQIEASEIQLQLTEEKLKIGAVSKSDFLQVKSELSSEKSTLTKAKNQLSTNMLILMQLMELPLSTPFDLTQPNLDSIILRKGNLSVDSVFQISLAIKPQVKNAELSVKTAQLNELIIKSGLLPQLSVNGSVNSGYNNSLDNINYGNQIYNKITPQLGLSLSVPIYQNKQIKSKIEIAKIETEIANVNTQSIKNQLRKAIELAALDISSAIKDFEASKEEYSSSLELYQVANEKFTVGMINATDLALKKSNLIISENKLLQSKFTLVFSYKKLDFYLGIPITL